MTSPWPPASPEFDPQAYSPWQHGLDRAPRSRADYGVRRDLGFAVLIVAALALTGIGVGFLWHAVSARPLVIESAGGGLGLPADTDKNYFGAEASFFAVTAIGGFVSGILAWFFGRRRGPAVAVAIAIGSVAAGLLVRAVGEGLPTNATLAKVCGHDPGYDSICAVYNGHLQLRVVGLTLTWAITSLAVFLTLSAIGGRTQREFERWPVPWAPPGPSWPPPTGQSWPPPAGQSWPPAGQSGSSPVFVPPPQPAAPAPPAPPD